MAVVLVADDEPAIRTLASLMLQSAGHSVIAAANGLEAAALYRSAPEKFDVVVTDLDMPVMDGYQLVELIRETRPLAKIICMSGNPGPQLPTSVPFLQKPFRPETLRDLVNLAIAS